LVIYSVTVKMSKRVLFKKNMQKEFFDDVLKKLNCISLRNLLQFGFNTTYSSLKNYYSVRRLMSKDFFEDLCYLAKIEPKFLDVLYIENNWGQVKGGKKSKRKTFKRN